MDTEQNQLKIILFRVSKQGKLNTEHGCEATIDNLCSDMDKGKVDYFHYDHQEFFEFTYTDQEFSKLSKEQIEKKIHTMQKTIVKIILWFRMGNKRPSFALCFLLFFIKIRGKEKYTLTMRFTTTELFSQHEALNGVGKNDEYNIVPDLLPENSILKSIHKSKYYSIGMRQNMIHPN